MPALLHAQGALTAAADTARIPQAPVQRLWSVSAPAVSARRSPKLLVYYDLEGMSGTTTLAEATWESDSAAAARGRASAVRDVLAVLSGLKLAGVDSIGVVDYHGAPDDNDVPLSALPRGVFTVHRDAVDTLHAGAYDGVLFVGMHTGPLGGGFIAHTMAPGVDVRLNGRSVNESEWEAARWGVIGVPVLFISGDDRLQDEVQRTMPWVEYVTVKHARDFANADTLPRNEVERRLANGARRAVERRASARVVRVVTPINSAVRTFGFAALGRRLEGLPGIDVVGQETRFVAPNMKASARGVLAIVGLAGSRTLPAVLRKAAASDTSITTTLDRSYPNLLSDYASLMNAIARANHGR